MSPFQEPGAVAARQPYPQYSSISAWEPIGISTYHALQLSAEKRFSRGLMFNAGYTFSRSLDMGGGGNSASAESRNNVQNPHDVAPSTVSADFNYSHRVTFNGVYDMPFGHGRQFLGNAGGVVNARGGRLAGRQHLPGADRPSRLAFRGHLDFEHRHHPISQPHLRRQRWRPQHGPPLVPDILLRGARRSTPSAMPAGT